MADSGKKKGEWQGGPAENFDAYQAAIRKVLNAQPPGSQWVVDVEVKRVGNPVHDYRIVLSPSG